MKIWYEKAIQSLEIEQPSEQVFDYKPTFFKGEQRKLYRDDITPLTDEERKNLQAGIDSTKYIQFFIILATAAIIGFLFFYYRAEFKTAYLFSSVIFVGAVLISTFFWYSASNEKSELKANRKRIIIAPVLRLTEVSTGVRGSKSKNIITFLDTQDRVRKELSEHRVDWEERDMVEMHIIFKPNGSQRVALAPTKLIAFKRQKSEIKDAPQQIFFKDEIVPLSVEDKIRITQKEKSQRGCLFFLALPLTGIGVFIFFFANAEMLWRLIFGGIPVLFSALLVLGWMVSKSESRKELANNKKRIIVAPVVELLKKTILGKPTKFYAKIKIGAEISQQEIVAETYLDLKAGDIIELQTSQNPGGVPTVLQPMTKIAEPIS